MEKNKTYCVFDVRHTYPRQPSCFGGKPEYQVEVEYNASEKGSHVMCESCKDHIVKDAEKHGYKVVVKRIKKERR